MTSDHLLGDLCASLEARWQLERVIQLDSDAQPRGLTVLVAERAIADEVTRPGLLRRYVEARAAARFRHEQGGPVPAPFPFDDPRGELRTQIGALRNDLVRHLAWSTFQSIVQGVPETSTMMTLHEMTSQIRELDEQVWGPVADPWAQYVWLGPREGRAPWAGGHVIAPGPEDVAVLMLLGAVAVWSAGQITVTEGADRLNAWGYQLTDGSDGDGTRVLAVPDLAWWHAERSRAGTDGRRRR